MKRFLGVALIWLATGCDYSNVVSACGDVTIDQHEGAHSVADGGAGGGGGDGGALPIEEDLGMPGSKCANNGECASGVCVPSNSDNFDASYCFDRDVEGCMVVTAPSPFAAECVKPMGKVYVCGDLWDVSSLGTCDDLGIGTLGETYRCCTPKSFP